MGCASLGTVGFVSCQAKRKGRGQENIPWINWRCRYIMTIVYRLGGFVKWQILFLKRSLHFLTFFLREPSLARTRTAEK